MKAGRKMKCKKCGSDDWYVRGKYKRCTPCHNKTQLEAYHNRKIGLGRQRKQKYTARPLSQEFGYIHPLFVEKKLQTVCKRGHELSGDNVRLDLDSKGRTHRRCRKCEYLRHRQDYGLPVVSEVSKLMEDKPWHRLQDELG